MKDRVREKNTRTRENYFSRSIGMVDQWLSFPAFLADMGACPKGFSLDRIDNDLGYSPSNCRWASRTTQNRNTRSNRSLEMDGVTKTLGEWSEDFSMSRGMLTWRLKRGMSVKDALTAPNRYRS